MLPLTKEQARVYKAISDFYESNGHAPTYREIAASVGKSHAVVHRMIERMSRRGVIQRGEAGSARAIRIVQI